MNKIFSFLNKKSVVASISQFLILFFISYIITDSLFAVLASDVEIVPGISSDELNLDGGSSVVGYDPTPTPSSRGNFSDEFKTQLYLYCASFFGQINCKYSASDLTYAINEWYTAASRMYDLQQCNIQYFKAFIEFCQDHYCFFTLPDGSLHFGLYLHANSNATRVPNIWDWWNNYGQDDDEGDYDEPVFVNQTGLSGCVQFPFIDSVYHVEQKLNANWYFTDSIDNTRFNEFNSGYIHLDNNSGILSAHPDEQTSGYPYYAWIQRGYYNNYDYLAGESLTVWVNYPFGDPLENPTLFQGTIFFADATIVSGNLSLRMQHCRRGDDNWEQLFGIYPWLRSYYQTYDYEIPFFYLNYVNGQYDNWAMETATSDYNKYDNKLSWQVGDYGYFSQYFFGNTLIISGTHYYLYWNGSWYDLGNHSGDPFNGNRNFNPRPNRRNLDDVIYYIFNTYNYYSASGNVIDYKFDLQTIIDILKHIDDNLDELSDFIMSDLFFDPIIKAINSVSGGNLIINDIDNIFNNTYNYFFTLNDDQKEAINLKIDEMKEPFSWLFNIFKESGLFLNNIREHALAYSSGQGVGSAPPFEWHDLGFTTSNNSASGNLISYSSSSSNYVYVPVRSNFNIDQGGGGGRVGSSPSFYMDFSKAESSVVNYGGAVKVFDFDWYDRYKPGVDKVIVAFAWAFFIWRLVKTAPGLVRGEVGVIGSAIKSEQRG